MTINVILAKQMKFKEQLFKFEYKQKTALLRASKKVILMIGLSGDAHWARAVASAQGVCLVQASARR